MSKPASLIGVDWAASGLTAWAFNEAGDVLARLQTGDVACTQTGKAADLIRSFISEWLSKDPDIPVIVCGEVGQADGPARADCIQVPVLLDEIVDALIFSDGVHFIPGLKQLSPPDILRGQETQLVGLGELSGSVCLPGLHTRHVSLEQGRVLDFSTEMTGEFGTLLLAQGALKLPAGVPQVFDPGIFRDWVERSLDTEDAASPFAVRAARLIGVLRPEHHSAALTGLLVGADIAAHYDPGDEVILVADGPLLEAYAMALDALGASVEEYSAEEATQDGLFEIADEAGLLGT